MQRISRGEKLAARTGRYVFSTEVMRGIVCIVLGLAGVASAEPKMLKGPYLQDLAPTSITVMWQIDELAPARLVVEGPGGTKTLQSAAKKPDDIKVGIIPFATDIHACGSVAL